MAVDLLIARLERNISTFKNILTLLNCKKLCKLDSFVSSDHAMAVWTIMVNIFTAVYKKWYETAATQKSKNA
jgi:hypothetical protein